MLVSVLLPSYNHGRYLRQRIDSILSQTYSNYELIILDDASTDESKEIIESYHGRLKNSTSIIRNTNSGSPFGMWNDGLSVAKGELIWIAESDDFCSADFLKMMVDEIKPSTSVIFSKSVLVDEHGKEYIQERSFFETFFAERAVASYSNSGVGEIQECFIYGNIIGNCSSAIFRKPVRFPDQISTWRFAGDWYFWIYLLRNGDIQYVSKPLNYWRRHPKSTNMLFDQQLERKRFHERRCCVEYALNSSKVSKWKFSNEAALKAYVAAVLYRTRKFGRLSYFGIFPPIPSFLWFRYYRAYIKLLFRGKV